MELGDDEEVSSENEAEDADMSEPASVPPSDSDDGDEKDTAGDSKSPVAAKPKAKNGPKVLQAKGRLHQCLRCLKSPQEPMTQKQRYV